MLDIKPSRFDCEIVIVRNIGRLKKLANVKYGVDIPAVPSFYEKNSKTLYIVESHYNRYVIAHELTHAIINQYFVVDMPERMQEVLAGYVEYKMRNKTLDTKE